MTVLLQSFKEGFDAAIIGASGGIGQAFAAHLAEEERLDRLHLFSRSAKAARPGGKTIDGSIDLLDEDSIAAAANGLGGPGRLRLVLVTTGVLHDGERIVPEKSWRALDPDALARSFAVNASGPALVAKHFLPLMPRRGKAVFAALSARVGSISDNRLGGWYGYRASKAALNMILRNLAIELARTHPDTVCVGLHPGTVDTGLSRPFQAGVDPSRLFAPSYAAERLLSVIDGLAPCDSGRLFAWDGQRIAF